MNVELNAELNTNHFLHCTKLQFPPRKKNSKNYKKSNRRSNHVINIKYKISLLSDEEHEMAILKKN
jgi:hypothetical protein